MDAGMAQLLTVLNGHWVEGDGRETGGEWDVVVSRRLQTRHLLMGHSTGNGEEVENQGVNGGSIAFQAWICSGCLGDRRTESEAFDGQIC